MQTYIVERPVPPPTFRFEDPTLARHARWAVDACRKVGACWLGAMITDDGMFSLVAAEQIRDLDRYAAALGVAPQDFTVRRVLRQIGPSFARAVD